ncbi:MAG: biotin/lipoyl-containing protein [Candidatus Bathyarchaeia archaeon]
MPTYEVFVEGKPKKVEVTRVGEKTFTVKIEDKSVSVELPALEFGKGFSISVNGKNYYVELPKIEMEKPAHVKVDEAKFNVEIKTPLKKSEPTIFTPSQTASTKAPAMARQVLEGTVVAPMTGKILAVKVKKGESVKAGQVLCILEAMKMENEVAAPKAGIIREIYVSEGSSVSEGEPLFIIG